MLNTLDTIPEQPKEKDMTIVLDRINNRLSDEEFGQVKSWIHGTRQGHKNAAWFVNSVRHGKTITKSQRGEFDGDMWKPFEEEERECCTEIKVTPEDPYGLIEHCRTEEHVHNLVATLDNRAIRKEFNRMVKATAAVIASFGEI